MPENTYTPTHTQNILLITNKILCVIVTKKKKKNEKEPKYIKDNRYSKLHEAQMNSQKEDEEEKREGCEKG